MQHIAIIVLGLGEMKSLYAFTVRDWKKKYNIIPQLYVFGWNEEKDNFDTQLPKLISFMRSYQQKNTIVSLIGISAGGSAALHAYLALKDQGNPINGKFISVCGRFNLDSHFWYPLSYGAYSNPAFHTSVTLIKEKIHKLPLEEKKKFSCFSAKFDEVVPKTASSITGAKNYTILNIFHFTTILFFMFYGKTIKRVLEGN